jgi:TetR/AcrR family transcriptional regulator
MRRGKSKGDTPGTAARILAAAERSFAAEGIAGARTDEIASAAHANKAMLYYYFGDKRRLHRAVLKNLFRQLQNVVYAAPNMEASPRERLRALISGYFDFLATHPNYPRLVHREAMEAGQTGRGGRSFDSIVREYLRPFHERVARAIREGIAAGEMRRVDPDHTVFTILGMTTSYFAASPIFSAIAGRDLLARPAVEERKRALLDFLDHGLSRKGARAR